MERERALAAIKEALKNPKILSQFESNQFEDFFAVISQYVPTGYVYDILVECGVDVLGNVKRLDTWFTGSSIKAITIPATVQSAVAFTFYGVDNLEEVKIKSSDFKCNGMFISNCPALRRVVTMQQVIKTPLVVGNSNMTHFQELVINNPDVTFEYNYSVVRQPQMRFSYKIRYNGTKEQWSKIKLFDNTLNDVEKVICTDGEIITYYGGY